MGGEQVCKDGVCYVDFSKKKEKPDDAPAGGGKFDAAEHVRGLLDRHRVLVFSKTDCPYCEESKGIFRAKGVAYETVELDTVENGKPIHDYLKGFTSQNTVPNIFIGKKHVGGCSDLKALDASGKLNQMLKDA
ncbi:MAG: thioredoxin-like protein [Olpidium bornovanus]|uniref:Thioredoxin-like protein n=1 Tax=Olpidium bornovanus TaxID=278681 RepID=A0A8H7ZV97_9FUNG|nr:MAG: thioredoxin-like protein [Olpidium bornovanus]